MKGLSLLVLIALLVGGCENTKNSNLPGYTGVLNELVVVSSEHDWKTDLGTAVGFLGKHQFGLPQGEARLDVVHIKEKKFNYLFRSHRNILIFRESEKKDTITYRRNMWSKGQLIAEVFARDRPALIERFNKEKEQVLLRFREEEIRRLISRNKAFGSAATGEKLLMTKKLKLTTQKDMFVATDTDSIAWLRIERERPIGGFQHQISQGIVIYAQEYTDTSMFSIDNLIASKDSITKRVVPGTLEGSYMKTSFKVYKPRAREITFKGNYAVEMRGLWNMENDFMGGPFYSITTYDDKNKRLITAMGYVFAPQFNKRDYLQEVEAVIKSIEF